MKDTVSVLKLICDFLDKCEEEDLHALRDGKARLRLEYKKEKPARQEPDAALERILEEVRALETAEAAQAYFEEKKLSKAVLRAVAEENHVTLMSKDSNEKIISRIIDTLIGSKLRYDALLNMDLK